MKVVVCYASRHGGTQELAAAIADGLTEATATSHIPCAIDFLAIGDVTDLSPYDAVVLGSAVYMGDWLREAKDFVASHAAELSRKLVWLFSSGPVAGQPRVAVTPAIETALLRESSAREHKIFGGRVDRKALSFTERAILRMVGAPDGDFRDWDDVAHWARTIAETLHAEAGAEKTHSSAPAG